MLAAVLSLGVVTSGLSGVALVAGAPTADAATSPSQQWATSATVSGTGVGATRTFTFGTTGVTAVETNTAVTGGCTWSATSQTSFGGVNGTSFFSPTPPSPIGLASSLCQGPPSGGGNRASTLTFSTPVINPIIHVQNLDASRLTISGTSTTGAAVTLTPLARNTTLEISGGTLNSTYHPANNTGCQADDGTNPAGACGSVQLSAASGAIETVQLVNTTDGSTITGTGYNDGWLYTLSYPTAPLTKAFSPAAIAPGQTSELTFTIANPANEAQPTLSPLDFTDTLPDGVTLVDGTVTDNGSCGSPSVTSADGSALAAGGTSVRAASVTVAAGDTCTITVTVTAETVGSYTNDSANITTSTANLIPDTSTTLTVAEPPYPTVTCTTDANIFNTGYDAATGGTLPDNAKDANWEVAGPYPASATASPPPAVAVWTEANVGKMAAGWADSPYGNAQWISQQTVDAPNQGVASGDWYYRFRFDLDEAVDPGSFALAMNFLADNAVAEVYVNGEPQSGKTTGLPQTPLTDPADTTGAYYYGGFRAENVAQTTLDADWRTGLNTIVVQIKSAAPMEGFDAQVRPSSLCPQPALSVTKTSDATADTRAGDTVTYTVTAENTGTGDFTAEEPAVVTDDLTGVLDDAVYAGDVAADRDGDVAFASPRLSWRGALPVGETVTLTYSVTVTGDGDGVVRNVVFAGDGDTPACDPPTGGTDPDTGVPCATTEQALPRLSITKTADRTELPAVGEQVTYTVTVTNEGPGDYTAAAPATATDDLTDVLDDATLDEGSITADVGEAVFGDGELAWTGPLTAGQAATVRYTVTYTGAGDAVLTNRACVPDDQTVPGAPACDAVRIPAADTEYWKTVDPASGTAVRPGQELTYTLTFRNDGEAAGDVDATDDLSGVLDDADVVDGPTVSDGALTASADGQTLTVTGSVPAGQAFTVTYTVRVKAFTEQGDNVLTNALTDPNGVCLIGDCTTENPVAHLSVAKTSDAGEGVRTGDTVTYSVTVTNDGEAPFTTDSPARATDDLSGVLDDATFNDDAEATAGVVSYAAPVLTWTGPLAIDASATFTYTVTVTNAGDHVLENTAALPPELCTESCDSTTTTTLARVVPGKSSDPASGDSVQAGQVITYTLTFTNDGTAPGPVDSTDDLTGVLDDAEMTSDPVSDDDGISITRTGDRLRVVGELAAGQTAAVTYQVTVRADGDRGDDVLGNVLTPDVPVLECADGACEEVPPPTTEHPVGALDDWKVVDPASGTTVQAGQELTYTLHFANTGRGDVTVDRQDVLTGVLDDADLTTGPATSDETLTVSDVADGRFGVTGTLAAGQEVTVTYTVTVRDDGRRGDGVLGNFLVDPGQDPPAGCAPGQGERPDCTVSYVSDLAVHKAADPESGTQVQPGQEVTYTLTFTNRATSADAPAEPVAYTDHMADVLDDATLTREPVATTPLTVVVDGDTIGVTGELPSGQTATVIYTVTVDDAGQGNDSLGNVVAMTGTDPVCVAGSPLCTVHEVSTPDPEPAPSPSPSEPAQAGGGNLPQTGATIGGTLVVAALLLLLGLGAVRIARRRGEG